MFSSLFFESEGTLWRTWGRGWRESSANQHLSPGNDRLGRSSGLGDGKQTVSFEHTQEGPHQTKHAIPKSLSDGGAQASGPEVMAVQFGAVELMLGPGCLGSTLHSLLTRRVALGDSLSLSGSPVPCP